MTAPSDASTNNDPINLDAACEMFGGERELVRTLVEAFLIETPGLMKTLESSLQSADAPSVMRAAHTMKSNFNNLCLSDDSEKCRHIEQLAKNDNLNELGDQAEQLRVRMQIVVEQLQRYLAE